MEVHEQTLIYLRGLPASGKSTWASEYLSGNANAIVVCRDNIREMLVTEYKNFPFGTKMESLVTDIELAAIDKALERGYTVIVDATNFRITPNLIKHYNKTYRELGISVRLQDFCHVPLQECIDRDAHRKDKGDKAVGEEVIRSMYNRYLKTADDDYWDSR